MSKRSAFARSALAGALFAFAAGPAFAQAVVPDPLISGPVTGGVRGTPLMASLFDLGTLFRDRRAPEPRTTSGQTRCRSARKQLAP